MGRSMGKRMIYDMDWRALGYWPIWKDGKKIWEKEVCLPTVADDVE